MPFFFVKFFEYFFRKPIDLLAKMCNNILEEGDNPKRKLEGKTMASTMDREFPMVGGFTSETGLYWNFRIWADGSIDGMYRRVAKEATGGWKESEVRSKVTKDCLKAIERQYGLKTDGRQWIK